MRLSVPGACRSGLPPRSLGSLHLLGEDVSQPMVSPGAPSRPPPAASHWPACHGARLTQGPAPRNIASRGLAGFPPALPRCCLDRRASRSPPNTAAATGSAGSAWSSAESGRRRDPSRGSGGGSEPRARARRRRRRLGAGARGGGGAHVRVFVYDRPGGRARGLRPQSRNLVVLPGKLSWALSW
jgi:hypothetical protein